MADNSKEKNFVISDGGLHLNYGSSYGSAVKRIEEIVDLNNFPCFVLYPSKFDHHYNVSHSIKVNEKIKKHLDMVKEGIDDTPNLEWQSENSQEVIRELYNTLDKLQGKPGDIIFEAIPIEDKKYKVKLYLVRVNVREQSMKKIELEKD